MTPTNKMSVNLPLLCISILVNVLIIRISSLFLPDRLYFSFSSFLFDTTEIDKPTAIAIKLSFPFVAAFLIGFTIIVGRRYIRGKPDIETDSTWVEYANTVGFGAFAAAFLMAWPYILLWDLLVDPAVAAHRLTFLISYFSYFLAAALFALAGFNLSAALSNKRVDVTGFTLSRLLESRFFKPFVDALGGTFSAIIATLIALQVP